MKLAKNKIDFIPLTEKLAELSGYNYKDWRPLFTDLFILGGGVIMSQYGHQPKRSTCYLEHSRHKNFEILKTYVPAPKCRKVSEKGKCTKPVAAGDISCYIDLEALVNSFIVPDDEDLDELLAGPSSLPAGSCAYLVSGSLWFTEAVNTIFQCYSSVEDEQEPQEEEEEEEDTHLEVLDIIGLWNVVGDWLSGALNFEHLMCLLDFQHGKYPKISYWEDLVSELAYENNVDKREAKFKVITLVEHHRRLFVYYLGSVPLSKIQLSTARSPSPPSVPSNRTMSTSLWSVRIVPADAAKFIAATWNKVHLTTSMVEGLHGHIKIQAPDLKTFLGHLPLSHIGCVRSYTLVPPKDRIPIFRSFGDVHAILAWCLIMRHGRHKGDLGYIMSFNSQSGLFDILIVSQELKILPRHDNNDIISKDAHISKPTFFLSYQNQSLF
ncbi:hypothetical protein L210DRAFT_3650601 [Boletus edulis BED1]|uniref:Uncharacterized protein n=1 Tax=Boletus edulis BED1 TaxID=1328754 RepID=A0AAD4BJI0_BOLED|nr:hypothetical protein L210DRAFT_3650601 [Boletus edulis BED1]